MGDIHDARVREDVRRVLPSSVQALGVWARSEGKGEGGAEWEFRRKENTVAWKAAWELGRMEE